MKLASVAARSASAVAAFLIAFTIHAPVARAQDSGQPVVYEGTVTVAVEDDFARGRATRRFFIEEQNLGQRFELKLNKAQGDKLKTGARIRVRGNSAGNVLNADPAGDAVTVLAVPMAAAPLTARKAVVLLVDILDSSGTVQSVSATCDGSTAKAADVMFGGQSTNPNVDGCYKDSSFGALGFGGAVYPGGTTDVVRVTINEAAAVGAVCNYSAWGAAADKAAIGVTLSNYQHRVYVLPANVGCGWAGLAYVGCGNSCQAWLKAYSGQVCGYPDAYAHEIGHNLGMWHASTDENNDGTLDCEYCDTSDFMGYATGSMRTLNSAHKVQMGWASGARMVDGSQGGTFTVSSLALAAAGSPQVVKVRPNSGDPYYLSLRTGTGYDAAMPSASTYLNRLHVHRYGGSGNTRYITALGNGQSYNDAASGITIRQVSSTSDSATFQVSTVCAVQAPTLSISPASQGGGTTSATSRTYTVTVTNRDSASCTSGTFALAAGVPTPLSGSLAPTSLSLAPGASGTATLTVASLAGSAAGNYTISASTVGDASRAAAATATYWIDGTAPNPPTNLRASVKSTRVTLSWNATSDSGGSGVARYEVRRNGGVVGSTASTTYTDSPGNGTHAYAVVAIDGAGNRSLPSAEVSVSVAVKSRTR